MTSLHQGLNIPFHLFKDNNKQRVKKLYLETNIGAIKSSTHKHSISRILNNKPPYIFEDGNQTRDFIHVKDIAKANLNALEHNNANLTNSNVKTTRNTTTKKASRR